MWTFWGFFGGCPDTPFTMHIDILLLFSLTGNKQERTKIFEQIQNFTSNRFWTCLGFSLQNTLWVNKDLLPWNWLWGNSLGQYNTAVSGPQVQQHWGNHDDGKKGTELKTGKALWKLLPLPSQAQLIQQSHTPSLLSDKRCLGCLQCTFYLHIPCFLQVLIQLWVLFEGGEDII